MFYCTYNLYIISHPSDFPQERTQSWYTERNTMHQSFRVPQVDPELGLLSLWSFTISSYVYVDFLQVRRFPYTS